MEYQIQPNSRKCAVTGRELQPGERFFSAWRKIGTSRRTRRLVEKRAAGRPFQLLDRTCDDRERQAEAAASMTICWKSASARLEHQTEQSR